MKLQLSLLILIIAITLNLVVFKNKKNSFCNWGWFLRNMRCQPHESWPWWKQTIDRNNSNFLVWHFIIINNPTKHTIKTNSMKKNRFNKNIKNQESCFYEISRWDNDISTSYTCPPHLNLILFMSLISMEFTCNKVCLFLYSYLLISTFKRCN